MSHPDLLAAIRNGETGTAAALLAADPKLCVLDDEPSALMLALYHRQPDTTALIAARRQFLTIFEAAALGSVPALKHTLHALPVAAQAFSDDGFTALHLACFFGRPDAVSVLLASGADCNALATNGSLLRPLHSAATQGSVAICRMLLDAGADPNATQQSNFTALHAAALRGNVAMAELLVERGAAIHAKEDDGREAADIAREAGYEEFARSMDGSPPAA